MKKLIRKLLIFFFGDQIHEIKMDDKRENSIINQIGEIDDIKKYIEFQRQVGRELYMNTKQEKYEGWVMAWDYVERKIDKLKEAEAEVRASGRGYDSSIEGSSRSTKRGYEGMV